MGGNTDSRLFRRQTSQHFLLKPKTEKETHKGNARDITYAVSCMQGWRSHMEDAHITQLNMPGLDDWSYFAVLDGHAGKVVAEFSAAHLAPAVLFEVLPARSSLAGVRDGLQRAFLRHDKDMEKNFTVLRDGSGSTCTSVLISPTHFHFANCGDSRVVLSSGGRLAYATRDHKPTNPQERDRIKSAGGCVVNGRVDGGLAVSRALGDFEYKQRTDLAPTQQKVSALPETETVARTDKDDFIVLACDGIWDVMSNAAVVKFVHNRLKRRDSPGDICERLIRRCLELGSRDNMSVLLVLFDHTKPTVTVPAPPLQEIHEQVGTSVAYTVVTSALAEVIGPRGTSILRRPPTDFDFVGGIRIPESPSSDQEDQPYLTVLPEVSVI